MPLTSPDSIPYPAVGDTVAPLNETIQGVSVATQAALSKRQQGSYVVPDYNALLAVTGMKQSDYGYVLGTKTPYLFDGGTWRLATPHMEFTATLSMTAEYRGVGMFARDTGPSTSSTMATTTGESGRINITDPGLYAITATTVWTPGNPSSGGTLDIAKGLGGDTAVIRSRPSGFNDLLSASIGNYRTTAPNEPVYFSGNVVPNANATTRVRITRLA